MTPAVQRYRQLQRMIILRTVGKDRASVSLEMQQLWRRMREHERRAIQLGTDISASHCGSCGS